jgi:hypothetical protein
MVAEDLEKAKEEAKEVAKVVADTFITTLSSLMASDTIGAVKTALKGSGGVLTDEIVKQIGEAGVTGAGVLAASLSKGLAGINFQTLELAAKLTLNPEELKKDFIAFKKDFIDSPAAKTMMQLGIDPAGLGEVFGAIESQIAPLLDLEILGKGLAFAAAEEGVKKLKTSTKALTELEEKILEVDRAALQANIGFITPTDIKQADGAAAGFGSARDAIDTYRNTVLETVAATQLNRKEVDAAAQAIGNANLSFKELTDTTTGLSIEMGEGERSAKGLEAALLLARGTGLGMETVTQDLGLFTKQLGLTMKEATERFGLYREVQEGTRLSLKEVHKGITETTKSLRFFGDTSEGVAASYKKFVGTLGTGKEAIAAELFGQMASQIGNLDPGLKAFLGTVGGIGGGGGALGGVLEVEEAIAGGDISGIIDQIGTQIETISGAGLLTRQEAISTGQQEQFFLQRELLKQFGLAGKTDEENTRILEMMAKGQEVQVQDIQQQQGLQEVAGVGRDVLRAETGVVGGAINVAEVTSQLGMTQDISEVLFNTSGRFKEGSDALVLAVRDLKVGVDKAGSESEEARKMAQATGATAEEAAKIQADTERKKTVGGATDLQASLAEEQMKRGLTTTGILEDFKARQAEEGLTTTAQAEDIRDKIKTTSELGMPGPTLSELGTATARATEGTVSTSTATVETAVISGKEAVQKAADEAVKKVTDAAAAPTAKDMVPNINLKVEIGGKEFDAKVIEVTKGQMGKSNAEALGNRK